MRRSSRWTAWGVPWQHRTARPPTGEARWAGCRPGRQARLRSTGTSSRRRRATPGPPSRGWATGRVAGVGRLATRYRVRPRESGAGRRRVRLSVASRVAHRAGRKRRHRHRGRRRAEAHRRRHHRAPGVVTDPPAAATQNGANSREASHGHRIRRGGPRGQPQITAFRRDPWRLRATPQGDSTPAEAVLPTRPAGLGWIPALPKGMTICGARSGFRHSLDSRESTQSQRGGKCRGSVKSSCEPAGFDCQAAPLALPCLGCRPAFGDATGSH